MAWLYQRSGSRKWWIGWRANGRQFLESTGTENKVKAERKLQEQEHLAYLHHEGKLTKAIIESLTGEKDKAVSLVSAINDWLTECAGSTSEATANKYAAVSNSLKEHLQASDERPLLSDVTTEDIRRHLTKRRANASASTVNQDRKILSVFFIRAMKNGLLRSNPVLPIKALRPGKGEQLRRRAFTVEELKLIYSKAPDDFWRYMILAGFYSGQRMGDLICLVWGAVDFPQNILRITPGKTARIGRTIQIPMAAPLRMLLERLHAQAGATRPTSPLWPEQAKHYESKGAGSFSSEFYDEILTPCGLVSPRLNKQAAKSGRDKQRDLNSVSFHCLRHTFVSFLKITGGNQAVVKELAGHSSDMVSDHYTHMPPESLSKAIDQLPEVGK